MHIAILSPQILGIGQTPETYTSQQINLAKCWADEGHDVDVITGQWEGIAEALHHERIRLFKKPIIWLGGKKGLPLLMGGVHLLRETRYDFVFSSEYYQPSTFMACLLSRNVLIYQGQNTSGSSALRRGIFFTLEHTLLPVVRSRYKEVIAKTKSAEAFVRKRGLERCVTIPCGYDSARFRMPSADERKRSRINLNVPPLHKVLVYAGNLVPRRDVSTAIRALALLRERNIHAIFLIAGEGAEQEKLEQIAGHLGIREWVHFLGHLPWQKLREVYWAGDVFLFPTHYEVFGMVLIEALACGLKIVTTHCPAAVDIIAECPEAGIKVPVGDSLAFSEACQKLFLDDIIGPNSVRHVTHFLAMNSWEAISKRILDVLNDFRGKSSSL